MAVKELQILSETDSKENRADIMMDMANIREDFMNWVLAGKDHFVMTMNCPNIQCI